MASQKEQKLPVVTALGANSPNLTRAELNRNEYGALSRYSGRSDTPPLASDHGTDFDGESLSIVDSETALSGCSDENLSFGPENPAFPGYFAEGQDRTGPSGIPARLNVIAATSHSPNNGVAISTLGMWLADDNDTWTPLRVKHAKGERLGGSVAGASPLDMWLAGDDDPWTPLHVKHASSKT